MRDTLIEAILSVQSAYADLEEEIRGALGNVAITPAAAIVIMCLGNQSLTATEIMRRRYYVGSNFSYTLRRLEESGFLFGEPSENDRRIRRLSLTPSGHDLALRIREALSGRMVREKAA